jgi:ubiquitin C-terminal hydrolase
VIDNLHEEVNTVKIKPYNEGIDDKGETDEALAEEYWKVHKSRNDSVIVNTFHGQTKQTLTCKTCDKSSRKFDYFYTLQMPLPLEEMRLIEIIFHGKKILWR